MTPLLVGDFEGGLAAVDAEIVHYDVELRHRREHRVRARGRGAVGDEAGQPGGGHGLAQALERVADGRLRLAKLDGRTRHALLGEQRVQHAQEVGIEVIFAVHLEAKMGGGGGSAVPPIERARGTLSVYVTCTSRRQTATGGYTPDFGFPMRVITWAKYCIPSPVLWFRYTHKQA